jgi:hypothetical protein
MAERVGAQRVCQCIEDLNSCSTGHMLKLSAIFLLWSQSESVALTKQCRCAQLLYHPGIPAASRQKPDGQEQTLALCPGPGLANYPTFCDASTQSGMWPNVSGWRVNKSSMNKF